MTKQELIEALEAEDFSYYYKLSDKIRFDNVGDTVHIRAILEFSNYCKRYCKYCGLNVLHKIERFRMSVKEIIEASYEAYNVGYKTIVLQSGEDNFYTASMLGDIVREVKKSGIKITLSCGELSYENLKHLKECGADKYLLKHETADPTLYAMLHPYTTLEQRIKCLQNIKALGYETGSGFMVGLPFQTTQTLATDILLLKQLQCDMAGIGPFISHPQTPLKNYKNGSTELTKRAVALTRIILPKAHLPATTALGVLNMGEKNDVFSCGANVVMKKITPNKYKKLYEIYPSNLGDTEIVKDRKELEQQIIELGRYPS